MGDPSKKVLSGTRQCPLSSISVHELSQVLTEPLRTVEAIEATLRSEEWTKNEADCINWNQGCDKEGERIVRGEVGRYIHDRYANAKKQPWTPWEATLVGALNRLFFQGRSDWLWNEKRPLRREPINIEKANDGDTFEFSTVNEGCDPLEIKLRLSSVDTPESYPRSSKFDKDVTKVLIRLHESLRLPAETTASLKSLVEKRVQYTGKLSALVSKDFADWVQREKSKNFLLGASYLFGESRYFKEEEKGVLEPNDFFLRGLGLLFVSDPDLIGRYFRERLPQLMATQGKELYDKFIEDYSEKYAETVSDKNPNRAKINAVLGPNRVPNPAPIFSAETGERLARDWSRSTHTQGLKEDWGLALVHAGLGFFSPEYANQYRKTYEAVQGVAREKKTGQFQDPIFALQDAGLPPVDYKHPPF